MTARERGERLSGLVLSPPYRRASLIKSPSDTETAPENPHDAPINNGSYIQLYTPSDFRAAAPDRQSEPSPQSRVCRLAPSGRELRTSPASVVGL